MDTGFYNVKQNKESKIFNWDYILDDGKKISGRNLRDLRSKVLIKGYKWEITNEKLANQSKNMDNPKPYSSSPEPLPIHKPKSNSFSNNSKSKNIRLRTRIISPPTTDITTKTGIKHVQFDRLNHEWIYDNGNKKFSQKYLFKLESDVKKYNLEWIITDESISSKFQNEEYEKILSLKLPSFYKFLYEIDVLNTNSKKLDYILKEYDLKNNGTGILFVTQISDRTGNNWRYKDFLNNSWLYGSTLNELENHVKDSKLKWQIINVFSQKNSLFKDKEFKQKLGNEINTQKKDTRTGIFRVFLNDCWEYCYSNNSDDNFIIKKRTLSQLKNEVLKLHLPWIILDEELYKKSEIKDKELSEKYAHEQVLKKQKESEEKINKNKILKQISNEEINPRKINLDKMFR